MCVLSRNQIFVIPLDCSPTGSSVFVIFQARILDRVAISYSRESPQPGIEPISLASPALAGGCFTTGATWEARFLIVIVVHSLSKSCPTICSPMDCSMPSFPVLHYLLKFTQTSIESVMPSNHLILCHPLLLLPSIFPSVRVFSNESALRIWWPKYWSFSFSISPSNEYSGFISFRTDCLDLLADPRDSQESPSLFLLP